MSVRKTQVTVQISVEGTVTWWSDSKGYGFLAYPGNAKPGAFVHYSAIQGEGFKTLREKEVVTFDLVDGPTGPQAVNVIRH